MMSLAEFLSGRPGAVLLTAVIFIFLIGLQVGGVAPPAVIHFTDQFGGALFLALGLDRLKRDEAKNGEAGK